MALKFIYDIAFTTLSALTPAAARVASHGKPSKIKSFIKGHGALRHELEQNLTLDPAKPTVWIHSASLGEFGIARPIVERIQREGRYNIVLSFFSATGYEAMRGNKLYGGNVLYMPWDSPAQVRQWLDAVRPACALIMVSEFWHNMLRELQRRCIPTFLVSAMIRPEAPFYKWYGGNFRRDLQAFEHCFAIDDDSVERLRALGVKSASAEGNPLFDNAVAVTQRPYSNPVVEAFAGDAQVFVAGSLHMDRDLELISELARRKPDVKFLVVPHETDEGSLQRTLRAFPGAKLYGQCTPQTDFSGTQTLIIDYVGHLASLYRYGTWAYVGGGFTRLLHSVLEPAAYGLPTAFGPRTHRKISPMQLMDIGVGQSLSTVDELEQWLESLRANPARMESIKAKASDYFRRNAGATERIWNRISQCLK